MSLSHLVPSSQVTSLGKVMWFNHLHPQFPSALLRTPILILQSKQKQWACSFQRVKHSTRTTTPTRKLFLELSKLAQGSAPGMISTNTVMVWEAAYTELHSTLRNFIYKKLLQSVNFFFFNVWSHYVACGISAPRPGIESAPPAVEAQSLKPLDDHGSTKVLALYIN